MNNYKLNINNILPTQEDSDQKVISLQQLLELPNNSIDNINCANILEIVENPLEVLKIIESKVRLIGRCYIIGININKFCEYYLDNLIDIDFFNETIKNSHRLFDLSNMIKLIQEYFIIESIKTHSIYHYMVLRRKGLSSEQ